MTRNAKLFAYVVMTLGVCVLIACLADWRIENYSKFFAFFAMAIIASILRVTVPKMAGEFSFSLMFVMIGVVDLPLAETVLIGCTSLLIETVWRPGPRLNPTQVFFAVANMALAIYSSNYLFHSAYLARQQVELPFRILIAASTCFAVNTFAVAAATSLSERTSLLKVWQQKAVPRFPQYALAGGVAWAYTLVATEIGWRSGLLVLPTIYLFQRTYSLYVGRLEDGKVHAEEIAELHMRTIEALAGAIEVKDDTTADHLKRVQVYAIELGRMLNLSQPELDALRAAAVLHDIGKLAVPEHIISKPGRLTPEEFEKMKIHPVVGAEILERVQFPYPVAPIVRSHHEKWDGTGYPAGLAGEDIPIGARIISAVDALDALASDRQYRRALPLHEAMVKIAKDAGRAFDPKVIQLLEKNYVELEKKAREKSAGEEPVRLSIDIKVERGDAPAAGFAAFRPAEWNGKMPAQSNGSPLEMVAAIRRDLQAVFEMCQTDGTPLTFAESMALFGVRLRRLIGFDAIVVYLVKNGVLTPAYVSGDNYKLFSSLRIPLGQGLSGWVAENNMPIVNGNPSVEPGYLNNPKVFSTLGSALTVPLETSNGVIGVLSLYREQRDAFTNDELHILQVCAHRLAHTIEFCSEPVPGPASVEADIDQFTGMPGPRLLLGQMQNEISRAKRLKSPVCVIMARVEGLRAIRDALGQVETARAIRAIGNTLKESCREYDFVARSGTGEFVMVIPGLSKSLAESRLMRLKHVSYSHASYPITVVTGMALMPEDGESAEDLLMTADLRLLEEVATKNGTYANAKTVALG